VADPESLKLAAAAVAGLGSLITLGKNSFSYLRDLSLGNRRDKELSKALVAAGLPGKPDTILAADLHDALVKEIDISVRQHLEKLKDLSARLADRAADPIYKLSGAARLFLVFGKANLRIRIPQILTYLCAISAAIALIVGVAGIHFDKSSPKWILSSLTHAFDRLFLFVIFIGLYFLVRAWTLAEYRRSEGSEKSLGPVAQWLVLRAPENTRMFFAQLLFLGYGWLLTFSLCIALLEGGHPFRDHPSYALYGLVIIFLLVVTFRNWAAAEFKLARRLRTLAALGATLKKLCTVKWSFLQINLALASCFTLAVVYFAVLRFIFGAKYNADSILIALFIAVPAVYAAIRTLRIYDC